MAFSPSLNPCSPDPVCAPGPVPRQAPPSWRRSLSLAVQRHVLRPLAERQARRRLGEEMAGLDHRALKDIGLSAEDVPMFVATWRPGLRRAG